MSIHEDARAVVFIADHAVADTAGKINALGVGFKITSLQPNGFTTPQTVVVMIDVPAKYVGQEFPVSVDLRREDTNTLVQFSTPTGQTEAMRIQQIVKVQPVMVPGVHIPSDLPSRVQLIYSFPSGVQVLPGLSYMWQLQIEGQHRRGWSCSFYVAGPPPAPVFGGPAGAEDPEMPALD